MKVTCDLNPTRGNGRREHRPTGRWQTLRVVVPAAVACLVLGLPAFSSAAEPCSGGRYLVESDLPFFPEDDGRTVIVVSDTGVSMAPCGAAARSWVKSTKRGLVARAAWANCGLARGRVKLKLRTSSDCESASGFVSARKPRSRWRFTAERGCETAILCEPGAIPVDTNGDGCDDTCELAPGSCLADADCAADSYCMRDTGVCGDANGTCEVAATGCVSNWDPVCGCDGETYSNACYASRAGANIAHGGACASTTTAP